MKKAAILFSQFIFLFFIVAGLSFAQTTTVKAIVGELPDVMNIGSTHKVAVNITNNGSQEWSSEHLYGKAVGKFEISKEWSGEWRLQPGETTQTYYKITAPSKPGSYKLRINIYNDNKRIGTNVRRIKVIDPGSEQLK